jgi:hypothetical protein
MDIEWMRLTALSRNDAVKELNFDRIYRIYRMEKRDVASDIIPHCLGRSPCAVIHPVNPVNLVSKSSCRILRLQRCDYGKSASR